MKLARDHEPPLLDMEALRQSPLYATDIDDNDYPGSLANLAPSVLRYLQELRDLNASAQSPEWVAGIGLILRATE